MRVPTKQQSCNSALPWAPDVQESTRSSRARQMASGVPGQTERCCDGGTSGNQYSDRWGLHRWQQYEILWIDEGNRFIDDTDPIWSSLKLVGSKLKWCFKARNHLHGCWWPQGRWMVFAFYGNGFLSLSIFSCQSLILASLIQPVVSTKGWNCCVWCLKHFFGKISNMHRCFCVDVGFALTHASAPHAAQVILALMDTDHLGPATWSIKTYRTCRFSDNSTSLQASLLELLVYLWLSLPCFWNYFELPWITLNYFELLWITLNYYMKHFETS